MPPRRRKKRFPEAELLARLRRYEEHLRSYGADIDAINNDIRGIASKGGRGGTWEIAFWDFQILTYR
jgi:hypothetical protein